VLFFVIIEKLICGNVEILLRNELVAK